MRSIIWKTTVLVLILSIGVTACTFNNPSTVTDTAPITPTPTLGSGGDDEIVSVPPAADAAKAYLDAWGNFDYGSMWNMLTTLSKDSITIEDFNARYERVATEAVATSIGYEILSTYTQPNTAQVGYRVYINSALVGEVSRDTMMTLSMESGEWRVVWDPRLILPELAGGNRLYMDSDPPVRGNIYDREGDILAANTEVAAVWVLPSGIPENGGGGMLNQIFRLTDIPANYWRDLIFGEDPPWIIPIGEIPIDKFDELEPILLGNYGGIFGWGKYITRLAYRADAGAHALGWVGAIPVEDSDAWIAQGYPIDATIGRMGIESWGEEILAGKPSASLFVTSPEGVIITRLAGRDPEPPQDIYTTLDNDLQLWAQLSIQDFTGAVVVIELDTGRILAMASSPTFNPNDADVANPNAEWASYFSGETDQPFLNRATLGQYPPGSIFKVITIAAALESERFSANDRYLCEHHWYGPSEMVFDDWTFDKGFEPSGDLSLLEGIMRSCNPWFYQIGYTLYTYGEPNLIAEMARSFGLDSPTGLEQLPEASGNITNPEDNTTADTWFNTVQQAIGQSDTTITPLQAAVYVAAIGNGGTLYQPQLVDRIVNTALENTFEFEPIVNGTLPISDNTLFAIQEGMHLVITNKRGTAYRTFANFAFRIYGKTGTASTNDPLPHAWFIGYTNENREDKPDIAIAVLIENIGDGSEFAAPIFRRLVEVYFYGSPQNIYRWETRIGEFNQEYFEPDEDEEDNGGNQ